MKKDVPEAAADKLPGFERQRTKMERRLGLQI